VINLFFPYYQCGDDERQAEIDLCLKHNIENKLIDRLIVYIDDHSILPFESDKVTVIDAVERLTYKKWIELSSSLDLIGYSLLCNSDIYFDNSLEDIYRIFSEDQVFLALSRWDLCGQDAQVHPNPHWSQDVWGFECGQTFSEPMLKSLDFSLGVPRCDNKVSYCFFVQGWHLSNPCHLVKSIHVHEQEFRSYDKKLDDSILGGVAYVYPVFEFGARSSVEIDVWSKQSSNIRSVNFNNMLEKWAKELEFKKKHSEDVLQSFAAEGVLQYEEVSATDLLKAVKFGEQLYANTDSFEVYSYENRLFFKNGYDLSGSVALSLYKQDNSSSIDPRYIALGFIPPVIRSSLEEISLRPSNTDDLNFWQYPCATERDAFEAHLGISGGGHIDLQAKQINVYLGLPWATYIDKKSMPQAYLKEKQAIIDMYRSLTEDAGFSLRVHSVCQQIHWRRIVKKAVELGITDLHISHKNAQSDTILEEEGGGLRLHSWQLIAVNYAVKEQSRGMERKVTTDKALLASFIGAHMKHYRNESRLQIFEAAKNYGSQDVLVDVGGEWHFNKLVYEEQVNNQRFKGSDFDRFQDRTFRYNTVLSDSVFSLCPEGAGPNTLRLWESMAVGAIPVLFSKDLSFFHEHDFGRELLANCVVWEKGIDNDLFEHLSSFQAEGLEQKRESLIALYDRIDHIRCF